MDNINKVSKEYNTSYLITHYQYNVFYHFHFYCQYKKYGVRTIFPVFKRQYLNSSS